MIEKLSTSNIANALLASLFVYFCWDKNDPTWLLLWLAVQLSASGLRSTMVYPRYFKTEISETNIKQWQTALIASILTNSVIWSAGVILFIVPNDTVVLLVLMFTFFVLQLSATSILSPYMPAFYTLTVPLMLSLLVVFFLQEEILHLEAVVVLILYSLVNLKFAKAEHDSFRSLITLQFEKEELAHKLELSVAEKNRFLAAASHDLRQPLHASGLLLSALDGHVNSHNGKQILADISQSMHALSDSFSSLLDMSKLDAGIVETDIEHILLGQVAKDVCSEFYAEAESKNIVLEFSGPEIAIIADYIQLERIIRNLVSNAVRYTSQGKVDITWNVSSREKVIMCIADTGIGIPPEDLNKIFSEYYQIDNPERDRRKGFGLGLAIVKRLCDLLDLRLTFESKLGEGTRFMLELPVGDVQKVNDRSISKIESKKSLKLRLLLIDDDQSVLRSMRTLLESWGCTVFCTESESDAIQLLNNLGAMPDMILADYRLRNNLTGVQACERIFDEFNIQIPVVIITGDTLPERLQSVVSSSYQLLHKPVAPAQLRAVIQRQIMGLN